MNKKLKHPSKFFAILLAVLLVVGMLPSVAFADGAEPVITHTLTVVDGVCINGLGERVTTIEEKEGVYVTLIANDAPKGMQFKEWTVNGSGSVAEGMNPTTNFIMGDGDAVITATYEAAPAPEPAYFKIVDAFTWSLAVPVAGKEKPKATTMTTGVDPVETIWYEGPLSGDGKGKEVSEFVTGKTYHCMMKFVPEVGYRFPDSPADMVIKPTALPAIEDGFLFLGQEYTIGGETEPKTATTHTLTIVNGTCLNAEGKEVTTAEFEEGTVVTIGANEAPDGMKFKEWTVEGAGSVGEADKPDTTFTMGNGDATVTVTYENSSEPATTHTLTIVNGICLNFEDEKWYTIAEYKEGYIILISPDEAPEGMQFDQWVIEGPGSIEDPKDPAGVFTMGNGDATVTATYEKSSEPATTHALTIVNGTCLNAEGKEVTTAEFEEGTIVTIGANEAPDGMKFKEWTVEGAGSVDEADKPDTTFTMGNGDATVTATYEKSSEPVEPHTHTLESIEAKTPTCTEKGNNTYYHCTGCGKYFKDATASVETTVDAETLDMIPHDYEWVVTVEPTTETGGLKEEICKVCGHKSGNKQLLDKLSVEYKLIQGNGETFEQGKEAVFASDAPFAKFVKVYVDGAVLENENYTAKEGSTIITMTAAYTKSLSAGEHTVEIISNDGSATGKFTVKAASLTPPHSHDFGTEWKSDADNHWKECSCGEKSEQAAHSFKWIIDKEATKDKDGSKHEECTVCGYKKNAVKIPATGNDKPTDPTKPADPKSPKTGDESNLMLWISLMVISAGAAGVLGVSRKKKVQE